MSMSIIDRFIYDNRHYIIGKVNLFPSFNSLNFSLKIIPSFNTIKMIDVHRDGILIKLIFSIIYKNEKTKKKG